MCVSVCVRACVHARTYVHTYVPMYKYLHMCGKVPTEASRGMGVPGAGLPGVCEVPDVGAGTQAQYPEQSPLCNCQAIPCP